jgi:DNA polymerase III sliding clamp (beta) subunit (PCNA family)
MLAFTKTLKFVSHAMATKEPRYYLNGVLFELQDNCLTLVATDGCRMAMVDLVDVQNTQAGQFIMKGADVKTILAMVPRTVELISLTEFTPTGVNAPLTIPARLVLSLDGREMTFDGIDGKYPDWKRVDRSTEKEEATASIGINPTYLAQACAALDKICKEAVTLHMHGATLAMVLKAEPSKALPGMHNPRVVVMPTRA